MHPLRRLMTYGQSYWMDNLTRGMITSGELQRLIQEDDLRGVTSNPAIFEKAITGSTDYTNALDVLQKDEKDAVTIYERLAIRDIQDAAEVLRPVYDATGGRDGEPFAHRRYYIHLLPW